MEIVINQLNDDIDNLLIKRNNIDSEIVNLLLAPFYLSPKECKCDIILIGKSLKAVSKEL